MAIRFASFETYKRWLTNKETGKTSASAIFLGPCPARPAPAAGLELTRRAG